MYHDLSRTRMRWLGAAGFELELGAVSVLVDPFVSIRHHAHPVSALGINDMRAGAIFVTHGHLDHAADVPAIAQQTGAAVYAATAVCETLHDLGVPARQLHPLAGGRICRVGHVSVLAVAARHVRFDLPLVWRTVRRVGMGAVGLACCAGWVRIRVGMSWGTSFPPKRARSSTLGVLGGTVKSWSNCTLMWRCFLCRGTRA